MRSAKKIQFLPPANFWGLLTFGGSNFWCNFPLFADQFFVIPPCKASRRRPATMPPSIVVFFMAHAGIAQMMAWVSWFLDAPAGSVAFRVFCPPSTLLAKPYFQRVPIFFKTTWGSQQFVYALQEGYRSILAEFPDVDMCVIPLTPTPHAIPPHATPHTAFFQLKPSSSV